MFCKEQLRRELWLEIGWESCSGDVASSDWGFGSVAVLGFVRSKILGMLFVNSDLLEAGINCWNLFNCAAILGVA